MKQLWILTCSTALMAAIACVDIAPPPADDDTPSMPVDDQADDTPADDGVADPPADAMDDEDTEPVATGPTRVRF